MIFSRFMISYAFRFHFLSAELATLGCKRLRGNNAYMVDSETCQAFICFTKEVLTEILLVAMGYNINKLHSKIQRNRTGRQLFEELTA